MRIGAVGIRGSVMGVSVVFAEDCFQFGTLFLNDIYTHLCFDDRSGSAFYCPSFS